MEKLTYAEAVRRLSEISQKIESGQMDIDQLAQNIKEAKTLITFCKDKLTKVEADVQKAMED